MFLKVALYTVDLSHCTRPSDFILSRANSILFRIVGDVSISREEKASWTASKFILLTLEIFKK